MNAIRSLTSVFALLVFVLSAVAADATYYTFAGKFTSSRGRIINIPIVGNTGCGGLTLMSGPNGKQIPEPQTDPVHMITRGVNTQPTMMTAGGKVTGGFDLLCVKHVAGKLLESTGTMAKVGGAFALPPQAWYEPLPGTVRAIEVKYITGIRQLATSFQISGPTPVSMINVSRWPGSMSSMGVGEGGTMATSMNLAPWLEFDKLSMIPVSMRSGRVPGPVGFSGKFTWCPGAPGCVNIQSAPVGTKAIVKYVGGGNQFGGTMSYLIRSGPNTSSLAVEPAGSTGVVGFVILAGSASQPTGRGYAQLATDMLRTGPQYNMHKVGNVGGQRLITMVTTPVVPFPKATNFNYGFPFTTMKVLARITGTALGNPMVTTLTAKGFDMTTAMGGRNISLVAGGIGITNLLTLGSQTPEIASILLTLPEPGLPLQLLAGALGLAAIAGWRARK